MLSPVSYDLGNRKSRKENIAMIIIARVIQNAIKYIYQLLFLRTAIDSAFRDCFFKKNAITRKRY